MKIFLDFFPILLFFAAYKLHAVFGIVREEAIYFSTPVLMVATAIQMAIVYRIERQLTMMHKITLGMVLAFGGITLALHDKRFIMWKPSVLYAGMSIVLAIFAWGMKRNILKSMLGSQLELPERAWQTLNTAWIFYGFFMAFANGYVALNYSEEAWTNFKIWGYVFPLLFLIGQAIYLYPHIRHDPAPKPGPEVSE